MTITLGACVIPPEPAPGIPFWYTDLTGWYDLTDDKTPIRERPGAHGAFPASSSWRSAAAISIRVVIHADKEQDLIDAAQHLASLGTASPISMRVTDAFHTTERTVTVRNVTVADHHGASFTTVDIDCLAADPHRYEVDPAWTVTYPVKDTGGLVFPLTFPARWKHATDPESNGRIVLQNHGTKQSTPTFRLQGPCAGAVFTNVATGQRVAVHLPIPKGSCVDISFATRTAVIDGEGDVSRYLTMRQWWTIPSQTPVATYVEFIHPEDGAFCEGMVKSAW